MVPPALALAPSFTSFSTADLAHGFLVVFFCQVDTEKGRDIAAEIDAEAEHRAAAAAARAQRAKQAALAAAADDTEEEEQRRMDGLLSTNSKRSRPGHAAMIDDD